MAGRSGVFDRSLDEGELSANQQPPTPQTHRLPATLPYIVYKQIPNIFGRTFWNYRKNQFTQCFYTPHKHTHTHTQ